MMNNYKLYKEEYINNIKLANSGLSLDHKFLAHITTVLSLVWPINHFKLTEILDKNV